MHIHCLYCFWENSTTLYDSVSPTGGAGTAVVGAGTSKSSNIPPPLVTCAFCGQFFNKINLHYPAVPRIVWDNSQLRTSLKDFCLRHQRQEFALRAQLHKIRNNNTAVPAPPEPRAPIVGLPMSSLGFMENSSLNTSSNIFYSLDTYSIENTVAVLDLRLLYLFWNKFETK